MYILVPTLVSPIPPAPFLRVTFHENRVKRHVNGKEGAFLAGAPENFARCRQLCTCEAQNVSVNGKEGCLV